MTSRRDFIGSITLPAAALAAGLTPALVRPARAAEIARELAGHPGLPDDVARDEDYWARVSQAFSLDRTIVNLNNGGVSPSPVMVQDAMKRHLDYSNSCPPPVSLWQVLEPQREPLRQRMARHWGVDPEELAFTRNSSEALQICQLGFDLQRGDEVLTTTQDYPRMITTFKQRERREGIRLVQFPLPVPCEDDDLVVSLFERAISPRTKLILMCHIINITGQILPVKRVVEMARSRGIPVIVDGAHALAHFEFKLSDLACDYYGVSLHKWLFAPHGTGLLYVKRDKIAGLWPMMAAGPELDGNIRKFEEIGTHPAANTLAIGEALTFHQGIGDARKEARLRFLRDRWARAVAGLPGVRLHTSLKPAFSCGIGTVEIEAVPPAKLAEWLWTRHRILVVAIDHPEFKGIRVTPSVYTTLEEVDRFAEALTRAAREGVSPSP